MSSFHPPMHWIGKLAQLRSIDLSDPDALKALQTAVAIEVEDAVAKPTRLYGHRVEAMFAYVLAGLGNVAAVKQEDSGMAHVRNTAASPPDFRVRLTDGRDVFIEVKSFKSKTLAKKLKVRNDYLQAKQTYASAWNGELYFAFWWHDVNKWCLLKDADFLPDGSHHSLTVVQAIKRSRMAELGDITLGTVPPLALHAHLEPGQLSSHAENQLDWSKAAKYLTSAGNEIHDAEERRLAWYLFQFGSWNAIRSEETSLEDGSRVLSIYAEPEQWDFAHGFAMIGSLSEMISNAFRIQTQSDGQVSAIVPDAAINSLGTRLPEGPSGIDLKLWRFILKPNYEL